MVEEYPKLIHFYNTSNESAMIKAIKFEKFEIFEFLESKHFSIGPHENSYEALSRRQKKILKFSELNFQGHSLILSKIVEDHFEICSNFSPSQIVKLMRKEKFKIGEEIKMESLKYQMKLKKGSRTIDNSYDVSNYEKVYVISDEPKSGRSTAAKQFASELKKKYNNTWISYVDLKTQWNKNFQTFEDLKKLFCNDKFEEALFMQKYTGESPPMRIFWDGVDELEGVEKILFDGESKFLDT
jgi:hypothetical protein